MSHGNLFQRDECDCLSREEIGWSSSKAISRVGSRGWGGRSGGVTERWRGEGRRGGQWSKDSSPVENFQTTSPSL